MKLGDFLVKANACEAGSESRAERWTGTAFLAHGVGEDLADFLLGAATVAPSPDLELGFDVVVKVTDYQLSHGREDIMISI
jgi:hypothetical protein